MYDYIYFEKLVNSHRQLRKKFMHEWNALIPYNLTLQQSNLLQCLEKEGAQKVSDLADCLCVTAGALTILCDKLVERQFIERIRDEKDRRIVYLQISDKGRKAVQAIKGVKGEVIERLFRGIDAQDLKVMDKVYTALLRNLETNASESKGAEEP